MNQVLMEAAVQYAEFLEFSGDDVVDPDVAVSQLESLAALLSKLTQEDGNIFANYVKELAILEERSSGNNQRVEFLRNLPESLGLEE